MRRLSIALVFLAGCAVGGGAGQLVVPKAKAANVQRWEYFCMVLEGTGLIGPSEFNKQFKKPGAQGWELVTVQGLQACFKRPADG